MKEKVVSESADACKELGLLTWCNELGRVQLTDKGCLVFCGLLFQAVEEDKDDKNLRNACAYVFSKVAH